MNHSEIALAVGCMLPFLSIAFLGMGITRCFRGDLTNDSRRSIRWSFLMYGCYWLTAIVSFIDEPRSDVITGDIFLAVTFPLGMLLLSAGIYFGVRSHAAAGRRTAMASVFMIPSTLSMVPLLPRYVG